MPGPAEVFASLAEIALERLANALRLGPMLGATDRSAGWYAHARSRTSGGSRVNFGSGGLADSALLCIRERTRCFPGFSRRPAGRRERFPCNAEFEGSHAGQGSQGVYEGSLRFMRMVLLIKNSAERST